MNSKIGELLDLYIKLAGENYNISDLLSNIETYDKLIPDINKKIEKIESAMDENKYFDASSEIIDRNIEVSLERKLDYLNNKLKTLKTRNDEILKEKHEAEAKYISLNKALDSCQSFIYDLSKFDYQITSTNIFKLIEMENERYDTISNEIEAKKENRDSNAASSDNLSADIAELERTIQIEEDRLAEVKNALKSKSSYVDEQAKSEDLEESLRLKSELEDIKSKRSNIVNSITYQTNIVRDELLKDTVDKDKIMNILTNIASRLNELPYLAIEDETILDEEYNQLCSQRDELSAVIENKRYNLKNKKPYEVRYDYLNQKLTNAKDIKEDFESLLKFIINQDIETTVDNLLKLKEEQKELESAFSSSNKAVQQRRYIEELISSYENDLTITLEKARDIKEKIYIQDKEITEFETEIKNLGSEKKLHFDLDNQAERDYDNKLLEDIMKKIEYLDNREDVGVTPNQVLDQIEMLLYENEKTDEESEDDFQDYIIKNYNNFNSDYTFEKVDDESDNFNQDEMIVRPDAFIQDNDDTREYSFSPIDNTGFVSFNDAYDSTK